MSRNVVIRAAILATLALHPANLVAQQLPPASPIFACGDSVEVTGVELFDRIVYIPVSVNESGPYPFVLDTGCGDLTALDTGTAQSVGLVSTIIGEGGGAGEELVQFGLVDSTVVSLPGLTFVGRPLLTLPVRRLDAQWGKRKDGLLGGDLLSTLVTHIDYAQRRVVFHDAAIYEYAGPGERLPVTLRGNDIVVRARVLLHGANAPLQADFLLDTGVRLSVFNSPFAREHALAEQSPRTLTGITGFGIGGASQGIIGRVRELRLGSFAFANPVMSFSTDEAGALADTSLAGIIGADILSRFTLVLDYRRSQIILAKNASFDDPFEFDMCGIRFAIEGERFDVFKVFSVYAGTPAALAGIVAGDVVTAIDGRVAGSFTREDVRNYLQREGATVRFTIAHGAETKDVAIRLQRMI